MPTAAGCRVEDSRRSRQARGEVRPQAGIAAPVAAHAVAEPVVPFGETRRMIAELITAGTDVPWLGDQLDAGQDRVLAQRIEEAGAGVETVRLAAQRDAEIEAEAVDM